MRKMVEISCANCSRIMLKRSWESRQYPLCQSCAAKKRIKKYPYTGKLGELMWKGGRLIHKKGYILVRIKPTSPYYPMAQNDDYILEHRLVMAQHLGRCLSPNEDVHHINKDVSDNRLENLRLLTHKAHSGMGKGDNHK